MPAPKNKKRSRSPNFMPQLLLALQGASKVEGKYSDLPASYREQPYNLASKVQERGGIRVSITFNKEADIYVILKQPTSTPCPTKPKTTR